MRGYIFLLAFVCVATAQLRCFTREYTWQQNGALWTVDPFDALSTRPALLLLADVELAPPTENLCAPGQRVDSVLLGWRPNGVPESAPGIPFTSYPVSCRDTRTLQFGVSSLGSAAWGNAAAAPVAGEVFAPQHGRVDMATASASDRQAAVRRRVLTLSMSSRTVRVPMAPLRVLVCLAGDAPVELDTAWRETEYAPAILPLVDCVHAFGGYCGANLGYVARAAINLTRHTDANRLHPTSLENGFTLTETFSAGVRTPDKHFMHVGWACGDTGSDVEAKWHLGEVVLHLDATAYRCGAVDPSAADEQDFSAVRTGVDADSHVDPTLAANKKHPFGRRVEKRDECCGSCGCDGSGCTAATWVSFALIVGVLVMGVLLVVGLAWWCDYDWRDVHAYPHPRNHSIVHSYESAAEYERIHGHPPPVVGKKSD